MPPQITYRLILDCGTSACLFSRWNISASLPIVSSVHETIVARGAARTPPTKSQFLQNAQLLSTAGGLPALVIHVIRGQLEEDTGLKSDEKKKKEISSHIKKI